MPIRRPDHGCHGYSSSRNSVLWAFSSLVVQHNQAARILKGEEPAKYELVINLKTANALGIEMLPRPRPWAALPRREADCVTYIT
jgi:hypothetical protein